MSPARYRQQIRLVAKNKYVNRIQQKVHAEATRPTDSYKLTPLQDIFQGDPLEKAIDLEKNNKKDSAIEQNGATRVLNRKKKNKLKNVEVKGTVLKKKKSEKLTSEENSNLKKKVHAKKKKATKSISNKANTIMGNSQKKQKFPKIKLQTKVENKTV